MWVNTNGYWLYKIIIVIVIMTCELYKLYGIMELKCMIVIAHRNGVSVPSSLHYLESAESTNLYKTS